MLDLRVPPAHVPPSALFDFDIEYDPRLKGDPHRGVGRLQYEAPELFYSPRSGNWIARGHDVIHEIMQDSERFFSGGFQHKLLPIHANPPEHAFYRKVLLTAFSPKVVGALLPLIEQLAADLIDAVVPAGECEFVSAVAEPLPVTVFMNMLGIPLSLMAPVRKLVIAALRTSDPAARAALFDEQLELFDPIIRHHLDTPQDDMLGIIIRSEIDGRAPDFEELRGYLLLLANAGLDTVVNAMTFSIKHLAEDLELQRRLRAEPEQVPMAVEEFLRLYAPSTLSRYATRDTTLRGCTIKAGERIILLLPAGNLDAAVFDEPSTFQLDRQTPTLTFGTGVHRCLGSHLARIEMRVVITQCLARLPEFRLDTEVPARPYAGMVYGIEALGLRWTHA